MPLPFGVPAPLFSAPSHVNPQFAFGSLGGKYILLAFLPDPGPERESALALLRSHFGAFRDDERLVFGLLPDEQSFRDMPDERPLRWFGDWDGEVRKLYGAEGPNGALVPQWTIIDPSLRHFATAPLDQGESVLSAFIRLGHPDQHARVPLNAPVLIVPRVLEHAFCRKLIDLYAAVGGTPSGVMRERDGKTVGILDNFKRRNDALIPDEDIRQQLRARLLMRLFPEIEKAFQFRATRIERYIVARYSAEDGGYFRPHRDNTTAGTAHRKFAVSINLNAEEFEGGDLRFPEFGTKTYRPPTGGAVVFSCSLLHEATPVTRGVRYATLPFLYDDASADIRQSNMHLIEGLPAG